MPVLPSVLSAIKTSSLRRRAGIGPGIGMGCGIAARPRAVAQHRAGHMGAVPIEVGQGGFGLALGAGEVHFAGGKGAHQAAGEICAQGPCTLKPESEIAMIWPLP